MNIKSMERVIRINDYYLAYIWVNNVLNNFFFFFLERVLIYDVHF